MRRIPSEIWRICHRELDMYQLHKQALADIKAEIYLDYISPDRGAKDMPQGGGSIHSNPLTRAISKLTNEEIMDLERDIQRIEDVYANLTPREQQFFDLHYRKHLNIVECSGRMNWGQRTATRMKYSIIEKMAIRLGYIR